MVVDTCARNTNTPTSAQIYKGDVDVQVGKETCLNAKVKVQPSYKHSENISGGVWICKRKEDTLIDNEDVGIEDKST